MPTRTTTRVQSSRKTTTPKTTTPKTTRVQSSRKTTSISRGGKTKGGTAANSEKKILLLNDIEYQILSEIITKQLLKLMMNINEDKKNMVYTHFITNKENNCNFEENMNEIDTELKIIIDIDCKFENSFSKKLVMKENNKNEELNIEINLTHDEITKLKLLYEEEKKLKKNKIDVLFEKIKKIKESYDTCLKKNSGDMANTSACNLDQILEDMMSNLAIERINKRREQALTTKLNTHNGGKKQKKVNK